MDPGNSGTDCKMESRQRSAFIGEQKDSYSTVIQFLESDNKSVQKK